MAKIIYTFTDEAPMLATYSFLPVIEAYANAAGVEVETRDISLAGRILAAFADQLPEDQQSPDALAELGELATTPDANIIKLPNISASVPQLKAAIKELRAQGFDLPDYSDDPQTDAAKDANARYDKVKGSAVNPVLREGNSDRRAPAAVKNYARKHPHSMGAWSSDSKTNVATMGQNDFRSNEQSVIIPADDTLTIRHRATDGTVTDLKSGLKVLAGEVVDGTFISANALDAFLVEQVARAKAEDVLFSVHLKATMMKVSDPIIFGHVVRAYFADVYAAHGEALLAAGLDGSNGLAAILDGLATSLRNSPHGEVLSHSFRIKDTEGRTQHFIVGATKHFLGLRIFKDIMGRASSSNDDGIPSYTYDPSADRLQLKLALADPFGTLRRDLRARYAGRTLTFHEMVADHWVGSPYQEDHYRRVLEELTREAAVAVTARGSRGKILDTSRVSFAGNS